MGEITHFASFVDIPELERADWIAVQAITDEDGELVAEREVFVRAGWMTHVSLYPRTR